jgi:PAS domain-containing protein
VSLLTHPEIVGSIAVLGALVLAAARQLIAWRIHQSQTHWPGVGITLVGIVFVATRVVHLSDASEATSLVMIRVQYGVSFLLPGLGLGAVELMCTSQISTAARRALVAGLVLFAIGLGSPWIVDGPVESHLDLFGHAHLGAQPGWLTFLVIPVASISTFLAIRRRLAAIPRGLRNQRRAFQLGVVFFVVAAINDSLTGSGAIPSVFILDYAFLAFGLLSAKYELRVTAVSLEALALQLEGKRSVIERRERSLARTLRNLEASNERYRHLAAVTGEGVVLCSGSRVLDVNDAACRILGHGEQLDPRQLRAQDFSRFVARDHHEQVAALLETSEGPHELALLRADGSTVQVSVKAVRGAAGLARHAGAAGARRLDSSASCSAGWPPPIGWSAVGTLAAGTAHEINNPLTCTCSSSAELLGEELASRRAGSRDRPPGGRGAARRRWLICSSARCGSATWSAT